MTVPSLRPLVAAALLGLLTTFAAACGEEEQRTGLLGQARAQKIKDGLADVQEGVRDGSCTRVDQELRGLRTQLADLPQSTDAELRERLEQGVSRLEEQAPAECEDNRPETTPQTTPETVPEVVPETVPTEPPAQTTPTTPPPVTTPTTPGDGEDDEGGGGGGEETPGNGNAPITPPGQDDSGGEEAPGVSSG